MKKTILTIAVIAAAVAVGAEVKNIAVDSSGAITPALESLYISRPITNHNVERMPALMVFQQDNGVDESMIGEFEYGLGIEAGDAGIGLWSDSEGGHGSVIEMRSIKSSGVWETNGWAICALQPSSGNGNLRIQPISNIVDWATSGIETQLGLTVRSDGPLEVRGPSGEVFLMDTDTAATNSVYSVSSTFGHFILYKYPNGAYNTASRQTMMQISGGNTGSGFASVQFNEAKRIANGTPGVQSAYWWRGTGSPEGVYSAPVGSFYSRTDGGAGTSFYVKESGTGNTGWVAK